MPVLFSFLFFLRQNTKNMGQKDNMLAKVYEKNLKNKILKYFLNICFTHIRYKYLKFC